jgi:CII-binding regulator of phage lambda lysogenization HflD
MKKWLKKILFPHMQNMEKKLIEKNNIIQDLEKRIDLFEKIVYHYEQMDRYSKMINECNEQIIERMRPMNEKEAKEYLTKHKS